MAIKEGLLAEFDHEIATTRKLLERLPDDRLSWKTSKRRSGHSRADSATMKSNGRIRELLATSCFNDIEYGHRVIWPLLDYLGIPPDARRPQFQIENPFGNGLLRSRNLKLIAAFDHRRGDPPQARRRQITR